MINPANSKINRQKSVILLVDNRKEQQTLIKSNHIDFHNSAFKQTQIDPLQPRPDISYLNEQDATLKVLRRKIQDLQKRVESLEKQNSPEMGNSKSGQGEKRKIRRKFSELTRDFKCSHGECGKYYGSETSLKNHIKLKHGELVAQN